ncbi:LEM3 (ligand-effect modulator 3) family protein, partial [Trifolium medium]|nr:LEM3 (ligand-effect modulator 3) family protein [Trifolium medium]
MSKVELIGSSYMDLDTMIPVLFSRGPSELKVNRKDIAWKSDRNHKFGKHVYPFNFQNGTLTGGAKLDPTIP